MTRSAMLWAALSLLAGIAPAPVARGADETVVGLPIEDLLGRTWRNERIVFPLTSGQLEAARNAKSVEGPGGRRVPFQLFRGAAADPRQVAWLVDLDPYEKTTWRFSTEPPTERSDIVVDQSEDRIRMFNDILGISLRRSLKEGQAPLEGVCLRSGRWVGGSRLESGPDGTRLTPAGYTVEILSKGPVTAEVVCRATFGPDRRWEMRIRIDAHEPVILIDESSSMGDETRWVFEVGTDFAPDRIFYRHGAGNVGLNSDEPLEDSGEPQFVLEPWLHWWERPRQGTWCGLYNAYDDDLLSLGTREAGEWVDPDQPREGQSPPRITLSGTGRRLEASLPLRNGERKWLLGLWDKQDSLAVMKSTVVQSARGPVPVKKTTIPQRAVIKHGDFPLDRIKDQVLDWNEDPTAGPASARLFATREDIDLFRRRFRPDPDLLAKYRQAPVVSYDMDGPVSYYLGTGDSVLGKHLANQAVLLLQKEVDQFLHQDHVSTLGTEPHRRANELLPAVNLAALMLDSPHLSKELRRRVRGQLAFIADTVSRPDFYSPVRGYSANPNMTSTVAAFQVLTAGAIPSHPKAPQWIEGGMRELKRELAEWSDENGGWLEAPHYAVVAYDYLIGCFVAAQNAGVDDALDDPRLRRVADWLAKISTPPDTRINGWRHLPPIGNTNQNEPTAEFGLVAYLFREKDPEFSSRMQWMHRQQGFPSAPGIGGFAPTLAGFRTILTDRSLPEAPPAWGSEWFPRSGVVLRDRFPSRRETQLYLIAGHHHDHYDDDSGSITLWGRGERLADDFGYTGVPAAEDHNMPLPGAATWRGAGVMEVKEFATGETLDYVAGAREGWTRQIAFLKDPSNDKGAGFFVLQDTFTQNGPATWRLWLPRDSLTLDANSARSRTPGGVDLDIHFAAPRGVELTTKTQTRTCPGLLPDGRTDVQMPTTQTALVASAENVTRFSVLLDPRDQLSLPAAVMSLGEGRGMRVERGGETATVFLSPEPWSYSQGGVSFEGTCGVVRVTDTEVTLSLGSGGRISAEGRTLESPKAATQSWRRSE